MNECTQLCAPLKGGIEIHVQLTLLLLTSSALYTGLRKPWFCIWTYLSRERHDTEIDLSPIIAMNVCYPGQPQPVDATHTHTHKILVLYTVILMSSEA